jgi:hypothetical protein
VPADNVLPARGLKPGNDRIAGSTPADPRMKHYRLDNYWCIEIWGDYWVVRGARCKWQWGIMPCSERLPDHGSYAWVN